MVTAAVIQARMGSTRLPGKVMTSIENKSMLGHVIERCKKMKVDEIVVCTTRNEEDHVIEREAKKYNVNLYRGDEENVLLRYYEAARKFNIDSIVRVTADCPLIDPMLSNKIIEMAASTGADIAHMAGYPRGLDTEVFQFKSLQSFVSKNLEPRYKEHVTLFFYDNNSLYKVETQNCEVDLSNHRWTVDTVEDLTLIKEIYARLYNEDKHFDWQAVLKLLYENPLLKDINSHIKQKSL
ncbi:glycosyltransferase family protein [Paenibacillus sp. IB182496]|uniref:Glycosyltransferase family protein n=1 Tax=Paenibacillus sabuli TaxID=2772509 RepID=A0A927GSA4_9BACL|nr:glycosyltransferase family protein [Paenibacillus sabuli]MBD2845820.1 glycosyltransferase family protein [Paenibacillus sabuli]